MSFIKKLIKATIDTASIPVAIVKDVATLGGAINYGYFKNGEHTYIGKKLKDVGEDIQEAKNEL